MTTNRYSRRRNSRSRLGCPDDHDVLRANPTKDLGADLEVPAAQDESLSADRADDELRGPILIEEPQDVRLVHVFRDRLSADDGVNPEQRLLELERGRDPVDRRSGAEQE